MITAQLPHHGGFRITARIGDTFRTGPNNGLYEIQGFSDMGGYCGGEVRCRVREGEIDRDLKEYQNPDGTVNLCADSVALFLYQAKLNR